MKLKDNINFLGWLDMKMNEGYRPTNSIDEMQDIIYSVAYMDVDKIVKFMKCKKAFPLLSCNYRATGVGNFNFDEDYDICMFLTKKYPTHLGYDTLSVVADSKTGKIKNIESLEDKMDKELNKDMTLEQLYSVVKNDNNLNIECNELRDCLLNHEVDIKLREFLFTEAICKKVDNDGYDNAITFIDKANNAFKDLNLNKDTIDRKILMKK